MKPVKTFFKNKHGQLLVLSSVLAGSMSAHAVSDFDVLTDAATAGLVGVSAAILALYTAFIGVGIVAKGAGFIARKVGFR